MTCVSRLFDSHSFTRCYLQDDSLILSNTFMCNSLLDFYCDWQHLHLCFLLLISKQVDRVDFFFFVFSNQVLKSLSNEILSFGFCLVNSECDAYKPVDHSSNDTDASTLKFVPYFLGSSCCLEPDLKPFFSTHILFFLAFDPGSS